MFLLDNTCEVMKNLIVFDTLCELIYAYGMMRFNQTLLLQCSVLQFSSTQEFFGAEDSDFWFQKEIIHWNKVNGVMLF